MSDPGQKATTGLLRKAEASLGMPVTWAGLIIAVCALCLARGIWGILGMLLR